MSGLIGWLMSLAGRAAALVRKPGTPTPVPPAERERRAMAALHGPRGYYGLGSGGRDPKASLPWGGYQKRDGDDPAKVAHRRSLGAVFCDCSGAIAWVLGVPRKIADYAKGWGYFSTDAVVADADDAAVELVEWVAVGATIEPWTCLVVYGAVDRDGDGRRGSIGHIGIVAGVPAGWTYQGPASLLALTIWHCAASSSATGAIRTSDGRPWSVRGQLARVL